MKNEFEWRKKNLVKQVHTLGGIFALGCAMFAFFFAQEPIIIFFLIFLLPLALVVIIGAFIILLFQVRKLEKSAPDEAEYRKWNAKLAKSILGWIIILILGVPGGYWSGRFVLQQHENNQLAPLQAELTQKYHQSGFMGDIKVLSVSKDSTEAMRGYDATYTYTEKLGTGKTYSQKLWINFRPAEISAIELGPKKLEKGDLDSPYTTVSQTNLALKEVAAQQQPEVKAAFKQIDQRFKAILPKAKIDKVWACTHIFEENEPKFQKLAAIVAKNQQKKLPLGGYYDIDILQLAKEDIYYYYVHLEVDDIAEVKLSDLQNASYTGLPDGQYRVDVESSSDAPHEEKTIMLRLQAGQVTEITDKK